MTFWSCRKTVWLERWVQFQKESFFWCHNLVNKQLQYWYIVDISRSEDNQTIKCGPLIEYNKRNIFLQKHAENEVGRLVRDLFLFFEKASFKAKASVLHLNFNIIRYPLTWLYNKIKLYKTLDCWFRDMLSFHFLEKGLRIIFSPPHFVYDFLRNVFLTFYYINSPNFIVWLLLLLKILGNMCIPNVCFAGWSIIKNEINLIFRMKSFFYMIKRLN